MERREEWLASTFVELADTLVADFDLLDFLSVLVERCSQLLESAEVGLALGDAQGRLRGLASSTDRMRLLELIEEQTEEGPCRDCFGSGEPVLNVALDTAAERWPRFSAGALEAGFRAVHALPLRLRNDTVGAMNIFSVGDGILPPGDVHLAQALADVATIGILQERAITRGRALATQLQGALDSRIVIEQAKGIVAERLQVGMDEAFEILRELARRDRRRMSELANALIEDTVTESDLRSVAMEDARRGRRGSA